LQLISIIALVLMAIPAIGLMRQSFGKSAATGTAQTETELNPVESTLDTMGGTLFPLVKVMELVPSGTPFVGGATYASSVIRLVPHSLRPGRLAELGSEPLYSSPATWLMKSLGMSYGPGFTPFAEAYLNFGWWGGGLAMFLFGMLFSSLLTVPNAKLSSWPLRMAVALASFALLGFSVRGSFNLVVPFLF
jgi:oligosaccharide repeat unit polymerase